MKSITSLRSLYLLGLLFNGLLLGACSTCSSGNCDNGQGTYTFGQYSEFAGDQYVGEFRDGDFNGQGTFTDADGATFSGRWVNGEFQEDIENLSEKLPTNMSQSLTT